MNTRTYILLGVAGMVVTVGAACLSRPDMVPSPLPAPPAPAVRHALYLFAAADDPWCVKQRDELAHPEARAALQGFAVVEIRDGWKAWCWGVRSYPTLIVSDAGGKELGRHQGVLDAHALAAWLEAFK